jgi:transcriptional regulator with XRE-family HTH domain
MAQPTGLRPIRERRQLSREELARLSNTSYFYIVDLEKGRTKNVGYAVVKRLAAALQVEPDDLFLHPDSAKALELKAFERESQEQFV